MEEHSSEDTNFVCEKCGHDFGTKSKLERHLAKKKDCLQTGISSYTCSTCGFVFSRKYNLQRHLEKGTCATSEVNVNVVMIESIFFQLSYPVLKNKVEHVFNFVKMIEHLHRQKIIDIFWKLIEIAHENTLAELFQSVFQYIYHLNKVECTEAFENIYSHLIFLKTNSVTINHKKLTDILTVFEQVKKETLE